MAGDQARTPLTLIIGEENMVRAVQNSLKGEVPMSAIPLNDIWQRTDIVPNAAVDTTEQPPSIPDTMPEQQASQQKVSQQDASQQQVSQQQATQPQDTQSQQLATQPQAVDQPALNNVAPMPAENVESPSQQQPVPLPVPVPASLPLSPGQTQTPLPSPVTPVTPVTPVVSPTVAPRITTVTDVTRVTVFTSTNTTAFVTATSSQHSVPTVNGSSTVKQSHLAAAILTFLSMIYYAIIT
ncbi:uncharacterized protein BYT42DRAFT_191527 [Radiomyces spectabilis]|uniref:uncharacterized protein n=1 Tax=Radiomyces spectabilis TaxID=64574 RepID=UPI00222123C8|nr:uncharacterized protein BYT42DRAFT_191527 [Radiomyces spectabilis]KAI8391363.1 hypothetical protein BYT42DRAFT_191527 [Radiomyces spectabilis]